MKPPTKILAAIGLVAASLSITQAQPYYLAGNYNGWSNNGNQMTDDGPVGINGSERWEYVVTNQTPNSYPGGGGNANGFKVTDGTWNNTWPGSNLQLMYDTNGSATIYFYPGTNATADGWLPAANRVGYIDTGASWEITGDFTSPVWGDDTNALMTSVGNGVYTNIYVIPTPGTYGFKFKTPGDPTWNHAAIGSDFGDNAGNAVVVTTETNQPVLFKLDLPNGRYFVGSSYVPPVTNQVVFAVDMTYQIQLGYFHPGYGVFVAGDFNSWPGPGTGGLVLVNDPPYNGGSNTNIWYGTNTFIGLPKSTAAQFKFTQNDPGAQNSGWETSGNRTVTLLSTNGTLQLPVAVFSDLIPADVLTAPTPVLFSVNMMSNGVYVTGTDGHQFDPSMDNVYVNGQFANNGQWYAWAGGINPSPAPPEYQMFEEGLTSIYTNTIIIPTGTPIAFDYKYGLDAGGINGGPADDEAPAYQNHHRVVRSTAMNSYVMPTDTFGYQYAEPFFEGTNTTAGHLTVGTPSGGTVPVSWLGRPGAHLQVTSDLTGGTWQDLYDTDGTNWTAGYSSTNGLISVTNWPVADKAFFRLVKP
jgi:hypothetical protein